MLSLPQGDGSGHLSAEPGALRWPQRGAGEARRALAKKRGNRLRQSPVTAAPVGATGRFCCQ